jgi:hypothetical protein
MLPREVMPIASKASTAAPPQMVGLSRERSRRGRRPIQSSLLTTS